MYYQLILYSSTNLLIFLKEYIDPINKFCSIFILISLNRFQYMDKYFDK